MFYVCYSGYMSTKYFLNFYVLLLWKERVNILWCSGPHFVLTMACRSDVSEWLFVAVGNCNAVRLWQIVLRISVPPCFPVRTPFPKRAYGGLNSISNKTEYSCLVPTIFNIFFHSKYLFHLKIETHFFRCFLLIKK